MRFQALSTSPLFAATLGALALCGCGTGPAERASQSGQAVSIPVGPPVSVPLIPTNPRDPNDIGTPAGACHYGTVAPGAIAYSNTVGSDEVERYYCSSCQPGGGANSSDSASKGSLQNAECNPVVELVFWGTAWANASTAPSTADVAEAIQRIFASTYFDALGQYGVNSPVLDQLYVADDDPASSYAAGSDELSAAQSRVFQIIDNTDVFSNRTSNTIFLVMMPPTTSPPPLACGSHQIQTEIHDGINTENVGWVAFSDLDSMTATATHELIEAITNPHGSFPGLNAWTMDRTFYGGSGENEIMDACNNQEDFINGTMVQAYWSNTDGACVIPYPALPTVTSLSLSTSVSAGGETVTITGTNFDTHGATLVMVDGAPVPGVACPTSTTCTFPMPAHADGIAQVGVTVSRYFASNTLPFRYTFPCTYSLGCGGGIIVQCTPDAASDPMQVTLAQGSGSPQTVALSASGEAYLSGVPGLLETITACKIGKDCDPPISVTPEESPAGLSCPAPPSSPPGGGTCSGPGCSCVGIWTGSACLHVCPCGGDWPSCSGSCK